MWVNFGPQRVHARSLFVPVSGPDEFGLTRLPVRAFALAVPAVARRLRLRRPHHRVEQLADESDRVDLVVVAAGGEAEQLGAEVGEP